MNAALPLWGGANINNTEKAQGQDMSPAPHDESEEIPMDMTIVQYVIAICGIPAAIGGVVALIFKAVRWFDSHKAQDKKLEELKGTHEADIEALQEELTVICYATLACLDGLMQLGANGNVTKAHDALDKHLNKKAHK